PSARAGPARSAAVRAVSSVATRSMGIPPPKNTHRHILPTRGGPLCNRMVTKTRPPVIRPAHPTIPLRQKPTPARRPHAALLLPPDVLAVPARRLRPEVRHRLGVAAQQPLRPRQGPRPVHGVH